MRKFIHIESSLHSLDGHYFEYAKEILHAAEAAGFEPILATGIGFRDADAFPSHWRVYQLFEKYRSGWLRPALRPGGRLPVHYRDAPSTVRRVGALGRSFFDRAKISHTQYRARRGRGLAVASYARSCRKLFEQVAITPDDIVFWATSDELSILGLCECLKDHPRAGAANWHLQFHLPVFAGRDPDYASQDVHVREIQHWLKIAKAQLGDRLHCHTTTEGLVRQYQRLGVTDFTALPWPAREVFRRDQPAQERRPLRILIPGHLRREKGKHHVAPLLSVLQEDPELRGAFQLLIAADPKKGRRLLKGSEQISYVEDLRLDKLPDTPVVGLPHPLSPERYHELIRGVEVGLLLYESDDYYARESGMFVELLATATPVIVSGASWLSRQLDISNQEHLDQLAGLGGVEPLHPSALGPGGWRLQLPCVGTARDVLIRLPKGPPGVFVRAIARHFDPAGKLVEETRELIGAHGSPGDLARFMIQAQGRVEHLEVAFEDAFRLRPLQAAPTAQLLPSVDRHRPRGVLGLAIDIRGGVAANAPAALRDILRNYTHYSAQAFSHSEGWHRLHSARNTVEILERMRPTPAVAQRTGSST